jgi:hypothetical protein
MNPIVIIQILTPIVAITTSTPDVVEITADATIKIQVSPITILYPTKEWKTEYFSLSGDTYTLAQIPFDESEFLWAGQSLLNRGSDYDYTGNILKLLGTVSTDLPSGIGLKFKYEYLRV